MSSQAPYYYYYYHYYYYYSYYYYYYYYYYYDDCASRSATPRTPGLRDASWEGLDFYSLRSVSSFAFRPSFFALRFSLVAPYSFLRSTMVCGH